MPDLHGWISQQIDEREALARQASRNGGDWTVDLPMRTIRAEDGFAVAVAVTSGTWAWHIAANDPAGVLRRCAADRKLLEIHGYHGGTYDIHACTGCGYDDTGYLVDHVNDCETLLALAEGYGITTEDLASLDRPERERPQPTGKSLAAALANAFDQFADQQLRDATTERFLGDLTVHEFTGLLPIATELLPPTPLERTMDILNPHLRDQPLYRKEN